MMTHDEPTPDRLYAMILGTLREMGLSEDLWPEVLKGLKRIDGLESMSDVELTAAIRRRAGWSSASARRKEARRRSLIAGHTPAPEQSPQAPSLEREERLRRLRAFLRDLDDKDFEIMRRRFDLEESIAEIARKLGMPEQTLRRRYQGLLERMRRRLSG